MMATAEDVHSKLRPVWAPPSHTLSDYESAQAAQRGAYEERAQLIGEIQNNQRKRERECLSKFPVRHPEAECSKTSPQSAPASNEGGMFKRPITPLHSPSRHKYLKSPPQQIGHPMKSVNGAPQAYPNGVHPQHMPGAMNGMPMPQMNGQMRAGNAVPALRTDPRSRHAAPATTSAAAATAGAAYYNNAAVPPMMQNKPYAPPPNHPMHFRQGAQFHPNQPVDYATAMQMQQLRMQGTMTPHHLAHNAQFQQAAQQHSAQSQAQHQFAQQHTLKWPSRWQQPSSR
ncbi:hypothetical protein M3Y99_00617400 [Aphelenchoides fujianensis]|nr:hypothetical protein M3Y99_00617400 [Aphelenchoides fujianensis]